MSDIIVENITKEFKQRIIEPGVSGVLKTLIKSKYNCIKAVDNISFHQNEGDIIGYIGPNGAGKSTTIKMLSGILAPTSGKISVFGFNPNKDRIKYTKIVGVVFGQRTQLWWDIPLTETLDLLRLMYKVDYKDYKKNIELFKEVLDIDKFSDVPVRQLSLGQRMRGELCAALLHNPKVLFLDEPTIGLDVDVKRKIRNFILELNSLKKTTILLTTHDISDIEKLCNKVIMIDKGRVVYSGQMNDLKEQYSGNLKDVILKFNTPDFHYDIDTIEKMVSVKKDGDVMHLKVDSSKYSIKRILDSFPNETEIIDIKINEEETEDIIANMYEKL